MLYTKMPRNSDNLLIPSEKVKSVINDYLKLLDTNTSIKTKINSDLNLSCSKLLEAILTDMITHVVGPIERYVELKVVDFTNYKSSIYYNLYRDGSVFTNAQYPITDNRSFSDCIKKKIVEVHNSKEYDAPLMMAPEVCYWLSNFVTELIQCWTSQMKQLLILQNSHTITDKHFHCMMNILTKQLNLNNEVTETIASIYDFVNTVKDQRMKKTAEKHCKLLLSLNAKLKPEFDIIAFLNEKEDPRLLSQRPSFTLLNSIYRNERKVEVEDADGKKKMQTIMDDESCGITQEQYDACVKSLKEEDMVNAMTEDERIQS